MADNLKNLGKVCITPEGVWDVNKEYDRLALVVTTDDDTQRVLSYVSRQHVPAGQITLSNKDYWQLFATGLTMQDITVDENGNIKMGDTVIYQIPLGDALGEIVVDKIKTDLTNHIMTEIRSYMNGMVTELISSFSTQIGRLIDNGFEVRNKLSGEVNAKHSGTIDVNVNGGGESEEHEFIFTGDDLNASIDARGGYVQKYITSTKDGNNIGLNVSNWPNWITGVSTSEVGTQYRINIRFAENTSEDTRTGTIRLTQNESGNVLIINVTQPGSGSSSDEFVFESNRTDVTNTAIAGNNAISLTSTKNGELVSFTTTSKPEWITITSHENGTRHEVTLAFAANDSENDRTGTVIFTQNESGDTVTINVTQYGTEHEVTPTYMVDVTPTPSDAQVIINNVSARNRSFEEGTQVVVFVRKEGYIEYRYDINSIDQDYYLTPVLEVQPDEYTFTANTEAEPNKTLNYGANVQTFGTPLTSTKNGSQIGYTVSSQPNWVTAINTQQNGNISGNMTANESAQSRTGEIVLTQNESNNVVTITIVQAGTGSGGDTDEFVFTCNRAAINFGSAAATSEVAVVSTKNGSDIEYTAQSSADWVSFSKPRAGVGAITVTENTSQSDRGPAIITLTQNESGETLTISITQSGANSGGGDSDSDVYVFEATPNTLSFEAGLNLIKTVNVVSTKNGNNIEFTRNGISDWLTASISNGVVTITAEPNLSNESRTGFVKFLQVDGSSTVLTVNITQAAAESLPAGSEFVGMLASNGQPVEQALTTPIRFSLSDNISKTLIPRLKVNGSLTDDTLLIPSSGYVSGAANTDKFTILNSNNALSITPNGTPSESITTSYEIYVMHNNYVGHYTFEVHWDA